MLFFFSVSSTSVVVYSLYTEKSGINILIWIDLIKP